MKNNYQYFVIFAACGNYFLNGLQIGWHAPAIPKLLDEKQSPVGYAMSSGEISIVTTMTYSAVLLTLFVGLITNYFGPKRVMVTSTVLSFTAWLSIGSATNIYLMCFGKFQLACGIALMYSTTVIYLSDVVTVDIRGLALTATGVLFNLGIVTEYAVGPFVSYKYLGYMGALWAMFWFSLMLFIPESPSHLKMIGKHKKAEEVLLRLLGKPPEVELQEINLMSSTVHQKTDDTQQKTEHTATEKLKLLFTVRRNLKAFAITTFILILQAFSGFTAFVMHMTVIFEAAGSTVPPHIATIVVGVIQILPCLASSLLVDRVGRKALLLASCFVTAITNFVLGLIFYLEYKNYGVVEYMGWLPLTCLILFMVFYWIGLGVIPVGLPAELLDPIVKDIGAPIACFIEIITAILVISSFSTINAALGSHTTFWTFSGCCALNFCFILRFLPETKRKTFEEIQTMLKT